MFLNQCTSVGAPTIDTMVGEPQLVKTPVCVCLIDCQKQSMMLCYTRNVGGGNMRCNIQAHHHEHTNDGHANVVMRKMQCAIT